MERITTASRFIDKFPGGPFGPRDGFRQGSPAAGVSSTQLNADWFDQLQEEVAAEIERELGPLDPNDMTQLWQAIGAHANRIVTGAGGNFVLRAGDTMTGPLFLQQLFAVDPAATAWDVATISFGANIGERWMFSARATTAEFILSAVRGGATQLPFPLVATFDGDLLTGRDVNVGRQLNAPVVSSAGALFAAAALTASEFVLTVDGAGARAVNFAGTTPPNVASIAYDTVNDILRFRSLLGGIETFTVNGVGDGAFARNLRVGGEGTVDGLGVIYLRFDTNPIAFQFDGVNFNVFANGQKIIEIPATFPPFEEGTPEALPSLRDEVAALTERVEELESQGTPR